MKKLISNGLMIAGMLSVPVAVTNSEVLDAVAEYQNDPRLETLKKFFQQWDCPVRDLSAEFLRAADQHRLDWRLLPSISLVESGGGPRCAQQQLVRLGWRPGNFSSLRAVFTR